MPDFNNNNPTSAQFAKPRMPSAQLYGVSISKWGMDETVSYLQQHIESGEKRRPHQVVTINPIMMMAGLENEQFMSVLRSAELVIPDGIGVVIASRFVRDPIPQRVAGIDLMQKLLRLGSRRRYRVYFLGSTEDVVEEVVRQVNRRYPGVQIAGYHHGFFGEEEDKQRVQEIRESNPDILFVARGLDTQEPWIGRYKKQLDVPVMMGVGGSFDVMAGKVKRAPVLFQKTGMEWFYRLMKEPSRYKRMLALPKFMWKVYRERDQIMRENQKEHQDRNKQNG